MPDTNDFLSQLYFYELDARDKIFTRLQLNFAIYASVVALLAYMVRMIDYSALCVVLTLFFVGLVACVGFVARSVYYTFVALTGHEYKTLPKSTELIRYKQELQDLATSTIEYNRLYQQALEVPNSRALFKSQVCKYFADCIDCNYQINERRRQAIRKSIWAMILAAIPLMVSALLFIGFDLDASSPRKVAISFSEGQPLVNALRGAPEISSSFPFFNQKKDNSIMAEQQKQPESVPQPVKIPPPPALPKEPSLQISTEDFKAPLPPNVQILNENKK